MTELESPTDIGLEIDGNSESVDRRPDTIVNGVVHPIDRLRGHAPMRRENELEESDFSERKIPLMITSKSRRRLGPNKLGW